MAFPRNSSLRTAKHATGVPSRVLLAFRGHVTFAA
jgi:hypothetical protein